MVKRVVMTQKNPHAVALGRKGAEATNSKLTARERKESARKAAKARWGKRKDKVG